MIKIYENVFVGDISDISRTNDLEWAYIHATKTMFCKLASPKDRGIHEEGNRLYLNWVDVSNYRFFDYNHEGVANFIRVLDFIDEWRKKRNVLIHCDKGYSRGPSIGLTWLVKRQHVIADNGFAVCKRDFYSVYEEYNPNGGIEMFLYLNWDSIL